MDRTRKTVAHRRRRAPSKACKALRDAVFAVASDMEEPLRLALGMVHVIGLVDTYRDEDKGAIGLVAQEAASRLGVVSNSLRALLAACREAGP
jgi:hypothetical protein